MSSSCILVSHWISLSSPSIKLRLATSSCDDVLASWLALVAGDFNLWRVFLTFKPSNLLYSPFTTYLAISMKWNPSPRSHILQLNLLLRHNPYMNCRQYSNYELLLWTKMNVNDRIVSCYNMLRNDKCIFSLTYYSLHSQKPWRGHKDAGVWHVW